MNLFSSYFTVPQSQSYSQGCDTEYTDDIMMIQTMRTIRTIPIRTMIQTIRRIPRALSREYT